MSLRTITGILRTFEGVAVTDADVKIELRSGSFTAEAAYLSGSRRYRTEADGNLSATLWANEEGETPSVYRVTLPDASFFEFTMPPGTAPLTWSQVRLLGITEHDPSYETVMAFIQNNPDLRGPPGPPSDGSGGSLVHTHTQSTPAAVWIIPNPFGVRCSVVTVRNAAGRIVGASIEDDASNIVIDFPAPMAGSVHLIRS